MFVQCTFKNVKDQVSVKNYALFKLQSKLEKLTNTPIGLYLMIKQDRSCVFIDCKLLLGENKNSIVLNISGLNFFEAIDNLANKMDRAIRKKKTQKESKIKKSSLIKRRSYTNDIDIDQNSSSYSEDSDFWDSEDTLISFAPSSPYKTKWLI